ncbi:MAG: UvrD-helicase domain-containing protein [Betaproteobacteria bacterium]|nr:UvrD-helicase domain-containing protein [Betaproteobacteria bacterium]
MTERIPDQNQRDRALDPARSFIVQAPAGSGKTDLLIKRYLALLARVAKPEEILAITFTRKAAAEMRKRVLEKLPNAADIAHRLRIMTIDAFCASLTRQMPVLAKFGAQPEIVEDASALYREAAARTLAELGPPAEKLLEHLDNNLETAASLLSSMLARRDQWLRKTGTAPTREELEAALASDRKRIEARAARLDPRASETFAREVLTKDGAWRKRSKEAQALSDNEPLRAALAALLAMPPARYTDSQWQALAAMLELLPLAASQLKVLFAETGKCDFTEVAQGALRALGSADDPTDLLLALDHRIHHILVDEFQDTSVSQWELLERLTAGWQLGDGRTLFLVGDPMQSIYRFREAEVALFLHARRAGLGSVALEPLTLSANFRSQEKLVAWFDAAFSQILPPEADETSGAVPFSPSVALLEGLPGEAASVEFVPDREQEASRVAALAAKAEGNCAILVRNRNHLDAIVPALKAAGIRYRAIEIERLGEKQVVQDLYALTRALAHLGDRVAWLAILRAPWCGLPLDDLHVLAGPLLAEGEPGIRGALLRAGERQSRCNATGRAGWPLGGRGGATIWELMNDDLVVCNLSEDGRSRLMRAWQPIGQALIHRERGTLRDRVEGVWLALGGPACVQSGTDLEDAEIFFDEIDRLETAGSIDDPHALAESLEELYALPDLEAGEESVQIMTIHKAKGLEFGTVIVPGLDRAPGRGDPPLMLWKETLPFLPQRGGVPGLVPGEGVRGLLLAPIKEAGAEGDPAYQYLKDLDREAEDTEAARLLYVAATRAERRLHLLTCVERDDDGNARPPNKRSLLGIAWPIVSDVIPSSARRGAALGGGVVHEMAVDTLRRLPVDLVLPAPPEPVRWQAPPEGREEEPIEFSWVGEIARHVGTVVHKWLQRIAEDELQGWNAKRVESLRTRFTKELERRGVPTADLRAAADLVAAALGNTLADERGRWLLGPHAQARSEYRLRTASGTSHIVDRVFSDESGERWVADWKTGRHEGRGLEAFLANERTRYGPQLERYAALLGARRLGLYFPLAGGWLDCGSTKL